MQTQTQSIDRQQIFTPDHIVDAMIALIPWQPTDTWLEPSAGDGAFIRGLLRHGVSPDKITAIEHDEQYAATLASYGVRVIIGSFFDHLDVKANIVIGNPPYTRPGTLSPYYHLFVESVIDALNPDYFSFIIPSRWMVGGKGLDKHRDRMMNDPHMAVIVDDMSCNGIFPTVDIAGGVDYFMWSKTHNGKCNFNGVDRILNEYDIIIRENEARSILSKVNANSTRYIGSIASAMKPFGVSGTTVPTQSGIPCWFKQSIGKVFVDPSIVKDPRGDIGKWKVLAPRAPIAGQTDFTKPIGFFTDKSVIVAEPNEVCTDTYIVVNSFDKKSDADNFVTYMKTKFFRFMLRMRVVSQDVTRDCYNWVPDVLDYTAPWTDKELYKKFGLTRQEQAYIESKIKAI